MRNCLAERGCRRVYEGHWLWEVANSEPWLPGADQWAHPADPEVEGGCGWCCALSAFNQGKDKKLRYSDLGTCLWCRLELLCSLSPWLLCHSKSFSAHWFECSLFSTAGPGFSFFFNYVRCGTPLNCICVASWPHVWKLKRYVQRCFHSCTCITQPRS